MKKQQTKKNEIAYGAKYIVAINRIKLIGKLNRTIIYL